MDKQIDFITKEKALLGAMKADNFAIFDGNPNEALDFISSALQRFPDYANIVIREQQLVPLWQATCEPEVLKDRVMGIDRDRRMKHNCAIDAFNQLNRLSEAMGLDKFCDIDTSDRYAVADAVGMYVSQVYDKGIGKTMDEATLDKTQEYVSSKHMSELKQIVMPETANPAADSMEMGG